MQQLSDDQTALLGCFFALAAAGLVMSLSYYIGRRNDSAQPQTRRLTLPQNEQSRSGKAA
ncbi:MAG: hypothetical protein KF861_22585 [Planctomycetaceae bacterium]|nr:hypothetical protein [Planctomycetaceae bacterium]